MKLKIILTPVAPTIKKQFLKILPLETLSSFPIFGGATIPESYPIFTDEFQEGERFFYFLSKYRNRELIFKEKGIGSICAGDFSRDMPIEISNGHLPPSSVIEGKMLDFSIQEDGEYVILESSVPVSLLEAYSFPHSVLASSENSLNIVEIKPNSLLGRFGQDIASVSMEEIRNYLLSDSVFIEQIRSRL